MNIVMRRLGVWILLATAVACTKTEVAQGVAEKDPQEVSLEQETLELKDDAGKSVFVTYFAKGDQVAVRLKIDGKDQELLAKGIGSTGNPIFSNTEFVWEMGTDSHSGKLTDKTNKTVNYKAAD